MRWKPIPSVFLLSVIYVVFFSWVVKLVEFSCTFFFYFVNSIYVLSFQLLWEQLSLWSGKYFKVGDEKQHNQGQKKVTLLVQTWKFLITSGLHTFPCSLWAFLFFQYQGLNPRPSHWDIPSSLPPSPFIHTLRQNLAVTTSLKLTSNLQFSCLDLPEWWDYINIVLT